MGRNTLTFPFLLSCNLLAGPPCEQNDVKPADRGHGKATGLWDTEQGRVKMNLRTHRSRSTEDALFG